MSGRSQARAPGRVNLIGEHTDYNAGFVLPFAIDQACTADVRARSDDSLVIRSMQRAEPVVLSAGQLAPGASWIGGDGGWAAYAAGVVWALAAEAYLDGVPTGLSITLDSDVPVGAGLSSSAAVGCATALGLNGLFALDLTRAQLAAVATRSETGFVGAPTGGMDQLASMHCEAGHVLFCDMRSLQIEQVPFDLDEAGLELIVVDSRAPHQLVDNEYRQRREACEQSARVLGVPALRDVDLADLDRALERLPNDLVRRRTRHVVTENARVQRCVERLRAGRLRDIGTLMTESHASMRDDFEITIPEIDVAVQALLRAGSIGARMTGGGFGGCVIALVDAGRAHACADAVAVAYERHGFRNPVWFTSRPCAGASIL